MKKLLFTLILSLPLGTVAREGLVVLQFDDGRLNHYTNAFPILEYYGLKGSFGVVTGNTDVAPTAMTSAMLIEMYAAGHEIHDHSLHHDAAFWGDTNNAPAWRDTIEKSLGLLASWGIVTDGWNQPGGEGQAWTQALHDTLTLFYNYSASRVGLDWLQTRNHHWNLLDDPLSLGRGGIFSWGLNGAGSAQSELNSVLRKMADGYASGLTVIPLFHDVEESDSSAWGLAGVCSALVDWGLPVVTAREAFVAVTGQTPQWYNNQAPNPDFTLDRNADGIPDGWTFVDPGGMVHELAWAQLYGPEKGPTLITFDARSPHVQDGISLLLTWYHFDGIAYTTDTEVYWFAASDAWQTFSYGTTVAPDVDRVQIQWTGVDSVVAIQNLSWIVDPSVGIDNPARPPALAPSLYPNPSDGQVTVPAQHVEIYDVRGRKVMEGRGGLLDVSHLPNGTYFVRMLLGKGMTATRKLVVAK